MLSYLLLVEYDAEMSFVTEFIDYIKVMVEQLLVCLFVEPYILYRWNAAFDRYNCLSAVCE